MLKVNEICYLFDVDGTLTPPRQRMSKTFQKEFILWAKDKNLLIVTGSDFKKTTEQVPQQVLSCFEEIYCCMGNEKRTPNGKIVTKSNFIIPDLLDQDLQRILKNSGYPLRTGSHIEFRTGMVNFSIPGRNANKLEREQYNKWDALNGERSDIVKFINSKYPNLEASIGGSISIDIIEKGKDKGQIIKCLQDFGIRRLVFVGDRVYPGGNDWGIVRELKRSNLAYEWYNVSGPEETLALIRLNRVFGGGK